MAKRSSMAFSKFWRRVLYCTWWYSHAYCHIISYTIYDKSGCFIRRWSYSLSDLKQGWMQLIKREHLVVCPLTIKHTRVVSLNAQQAKPGVHLIDTTHVCYIVNEHTTNCSRFYHTCLSKMQKVYQFMWYNMYLFSFQSWVLILQFVSSRLKKLDEQIGYCWCPIVMKLSLCLQHVVAVVAPLWCHTLE